MSDTDIDAAMPPEPSAPLTPEADLAPAPKKRAAKPKAEAEAPADEPAEAQAKPARAAKAKAAPAAEAEAPAAPAAKPAKAAPVAEAAPPPTVKPAREPYTGKTVVVTQVRSGAGRMKYQRQTLVGLGLGKIGRTVEVRDNPSTRGMIAAVAHLVRIEAE